MSYKLRRELTEYIHSMKVFILTPQHLGIFRETRAGTIKRRLGKGKIDNDIVKMFVLLCDSHNFYGKAASLVEQRAIRLKQDTFIWISPEDLQHFKLRWDKLIKELLRVGIDAVMLPPKNRFLQFVSALKLYGHSTVVQMQCIVRASEVDTNTDYDIPKFYDNLISLSISQHPQYLQGLHRLKILPRYKPGQ